ncbi:winged helix-turn-helix transcriptional regulator [Rhodococcus sp. HNM0569]|nr:MarR family winged helix-turn-helix transcriptional regulator [Rhodococcus sp. HNM0569]NLU84878.1 winged helix-turn-helix transcriptional regulator [Rhodococcus sp. HNM0569]
MTSPRGTDRLERSARVILSRLDAQGPMSVTELVDAFGLAASTLNRQTSALLRSGLVERILDPAGTIARKFRITDEGARRLADERALVTEGLAAVVADWPAARIERFVDDLRQFNVDIERLTGRPWPRP